MPRDPDSFRDTAQVLAGPQTLDLHEVAAVLARALERPVRYTFPSLWTFVRRLRRRGVSWDTVAFMCIVYTLTRRGRNETCTTKLPELLGRPATTIKQWAEDYRPVFETRSWT